VGETLSNFTDIVNQPKLTVTEVSITNQANQHFQVLLDANGFIGPDGNSIPITTEVGSTSNRKQATVVIDTGFSLPQVPRWVLLTASSRSDLMPVPPVLLQRLFTAASTEQNLSTTPRLGRFGSCPAPRKSMSRLNLGAKRFRYTLSTLRCACDFHLLGFRSLTQHQGSEDLWSEPPNELCRRKRLPWSSTSVNAGSHTHLCMLTSMLSVPASIV
jgi:hypothetical protein